MGKLKVYGGFIVLAALAAAVFGALHDQISYTVSPEYFTRFKFGQFRLLNEAVPERLRAAQVGVLGSWWMGPPLGALSGLGAFIHRDPARMRRALRWSLLVIVGFALAYALGGLVWGYLQTKTIDPGRYADWFIPEGLENLRSYLCVGHMHNAAYAGGGLAVPVAWIFHVIYRWRGSSGPRTDA